MKQQQSLRRYLFCLIIILSIFTFIATIVAATAVVNYEATYFIQNLCSRFTWFFIIHFTFQGVKLFEEVRMINFQVEC